MVKLEFVVKIGLKKYLKHNNMKKGDLIKLTKINDDKFKGHHPNQINEGFSIIGTITNNVSVGDALFLVTPEDKRYHYFHTSVITEIIDESKFKTFNSTYEVEILNNNKPKSV